MKEWNKILFLKIFLLFLSLAKIWAIKIWANSVQFTLSKLKPIKSIIDKSLDRWMTSDRKSRFRWKNFELVERVDAGANFGHQVQTTKWKGALCSCLGDSYVKNGDL